MVSPKKKKSTVQQRFSAVFTCIHGTETRCTFDTVRLKSRRVQSPRLVKSRLTSARAASRAIVADCRPSTVKPRRTEENTIKTAPALMILGGGTVANIPGDSPTQRRDHHVANARNYVTRNENGRRVFATSCLQWRPFS